MLRHGSQPLAELLGRTHDQHEANLARRLATLRLDLGEYAFAFVKSVTA
jgi:hypothetical protein